MKYRLKVGHLYGHLNPEQGGGRSYGMLMVPWIKTVKGILGTGLKETKAMSDYLRASVEADDDINRAWDGAFVDVDSVMFPCLRNLTYLPPEHSTYIEVLDKQEPGLAGMVTCTVVTKKYEEIAIIKEAMRKLLDINAWTEVRRLSEVLMDIEDEQSV